jgi:hypothetical protein
MWLVDESTACAIFGVYGPGIILVGFSSIAKS